MRHKRRELSERKQLEQLLSEIGHGTLALNGADGWPRLRPVNFVVLDGRIYFHGSAKGEKMEALAADDRIVFLAVREYALIPSYLLDPARACPATQFYESVLIRGRARVVADLDEKARALEALMNKLQPEGGHVPITAKDPLYAASVRTTAVVCIDVEEMVGKTNVGQDRSAEKRQMICEGLARRDGAHDRATLARMGCPVSGEEQQREA